MMVKLLLFAILLSFPIGINGIILSHPANSDSAPVVSSTPTPPPIYNNQEVYVLPLSEPSYIPILNSNIPRPEIDAKSAIVFNLRSSRFLYQSNVREKLPIASLTKILTAAVVLEELDPQGVVRVSADSVRVDGSRQDLYVGEQITVDSLLRLMLINSSNDAAYALAHYAKDQGIDFIQEMNKKAQALGMTDSYFTDPAGLDDSAYSTVYDLIKLVRGTLQYDQIWNTLIERESTVSSVDGKITHTLKNTDELLGIIPDIIGGKTGYTDGALGCLVLLVNIPEHNDTIISIVLGSHDRFGDMQKIVDWVKSAYRWE